MKIAILGSGNGTNGRSILSHYKNGSLGKVKEISLYSDVIDSPFLKLSNEFNCKSSFIESCKNTKVIKDSYEQLWIQTINQNKPDLIVLAGFMKILGKKFLNNFNGKVINLHPSLLPSFKGMNAIEQAYEYGVKVTGCTVHWVSQFVDEGSIIAQIPVRILEDDTIETLSKKIHDAEHLLLPKVIKEISCNWYDIK